MHGPRNGRMFSAAHRPPVPHGKQATPQPLCRPNATQQHLRHVERLNKKIGTMKLASPIHKKGGHLRALTSQDGRACSDTTTHDPARILQFQRKPAHIKALEDCKKPRLLPAPASARRIGSGAGAQADSELIARARIELSELRRQLSALTAGINFGQLDRVVAHWGEDMLEGLRHAFDELIQLSLSFSHLCNPTILARAGSGEAGKSNCIQIKSAVVSLRAFCDRLAEQPSDIDVASKIVRVAQQGLVEQMLSWAGECESSYEVILPEKRIAGKSVPQLNPAATEQQRPCNGPYQRARKHLVVQPRRDGSIAGGGQATVRTLSDPSPRSHAADVAVSANHRFRHPSPPVDPCPSSVSRTSPAPFTYSSAPRSCKTMAERRDRLQRHRPPMLIIPA